MNPFYRKPKPETMKKNREIARTQYKEEMQWLKDNLDSLAKTKNKFMIEMYTILITGSRKITPKMESAIINGVTKCKNSPVYDEEMRTEADKKLKPIINKIDMVLSMAKDKEDGAVDFIQNVKDYVHTNHRITKKQMEALNKVYKRCTENLFNEGEK